MTPNCGARRNLVNRTKTTQGISQETMKKQREKDPANEQKMLKHVGNLKIARKQRNLLKKTSHMQCKSSFIAKFRIVRTTCNVKCA